jgi:hypothetical protein
MEAENEAGRGNLYTCARPGRSIGKNAAVSDNVVRKWADGLPNSGGVVIVSLLGRKPDGVSEFSFYSFYGGFETQADRPGALHFVEWLDRTYPDKRFQLFEHPTIDFKQVPAATLDQLRATIEPFFDMDRTVIFVDSDGEGRVRPVCAYLGLVEDTASYGT